MVDSLKELEIRVQLIHGFSKPKLRLEQYITPAKLIASIVWLSFIRGELGRVVDIGCGPGGFAIASSLLGSYSICIDVDPDAVEDCVDNSRELDVDAAVMDALLPAIRDGFNATCFANPPFGIWSRKGIDVEIVKSSMSFCNIIYSIHKSSAATAVTRKTRGNIVDTSTLLIPHVYSHHRRIKYPIDVIVIRSTKPQDQDA